jgi:hypothetical protein
VGVGWEGREGVGWEGVRVGWALGFGDYLDAGLPVAKSATNPYTTTLVGRVSGGEGRHSEERGWPCGRPTH